MVTQTVINKMDPEIEAYKLGLLGDAQGLVQGQMFGQNVQNLRQQYQGQVNPDTGVEYTPEELNTVIATQLSTEGSPVTADMVSEQAVPSGGMYGLPDFKIADLSQSQKDAYTLASQGVGSYKPYLAGGLDAVQKGQAGAYDAMLGVGGATDQAGMTTGQAQQGIQQAGQFGMQAAQEGLAGLQGVAGEFDPSGIGAFYNPYEQDVVQATLDDLRQDFQTQKAQRQAQSDAEAVSRGAFSSVSSQMRRDAQNIQPLEEDYLKTAAKEIGALRAAGFTNAANQAATAFEQAKQRQLGGAQATSAIGQQGAGTGLQAGQATGNLALGLGNLGLSGASTQAGIGQQLAGMGIQQAGLGEMEKSLQQQDIGALTGTGGMLQAQKQAELDAQKATDTQQYQQPYQQIGFLSDVYSGVPTSQATTTMSTGTPASAFQQAAGMGIAALGAAGGAKNLGIM
jgi:hypothetical protein